MLWSASRNVLQRHCNIIILKLQFWIDPFRIWHFDHDVIVFGLLDRASDHRWILPFLVKEDFRFRAYRILVSTVDIQRLIPQVYSLFQENSLQITDRSVVGLASTNWQLSYMLRIFNCHDYLAKMVGILICYALNTVLSLVNHKQGCRQTSMHQMKFQLAILIFVSLKIDHKLIEEGQQSRFQLLWASDANCMVAINVIFSIWCYDRWCAHLLHECSLGNILDPLVNWDALLFSSDFILVYSLIAIIEVRINRN